MSAHHSDDERDEQHAQYRPEPSPAADEFDDAFSDSADDHDRLEFSPEAIRAELERNYGSIDEHVTQDEADDYARRIDAAHEADAPVPTVDANAPGPALQEPPSRPPMPHTTSSSSQFPSSVSHDGSFYEVQLSNSVSHIALSEEPPSPPAQMPHTANDVVVYPPVHIEASKFSDIAVRTADDYEQDTSVSVDLPQRSVSHDETRTRRVSPQPITPGSAASVASTSSSHIPSSSSLPTPKSSASNSSTTSNFQHRSARSMGPSMLDKVVSKTRPTFLPPKQRTEDRKHMADWEEMMRRSRAAEEKRRKALQERRYARERRIEESIGVWEREIVPDWTAVHRNPALRKLWWEGIPTKLRASMWQNAVGNALVLGNDAYRTCSSRAKRALAHGTFPTTALGLLEEDIKTTLPNLHLFLPEAGPLYQDLKDMLCAWVVARSDEGLGYIPGVAKLAAMLLINMAPAQGFVVLRNLLERHCMRSFYRRPASKNDVSCAPLEQANDNVEAYYRIFDTLLADGMPKIYFNFKQHQISPAEYLPEWLVPLFLDHLPFDACARIWDIVILEGDSFLFRAALAILAVLEPRLFFPERRELLELLKGENKAAIEVAKRNGRPTNGAKYEIYDVDEETLWERIDSMDEWWREGTWTRLIQRELPDI